MSTNDANPGRPLEETTRSFIRPYDWSPAKVQYRVATVCILCGQILKEAVSETCNRFLLQDRQTILRGVSLQNGPYVVPVRCRVDPPSYRPSMNFERGAGPSVIE